MNKRAWSSIIVVLLLLLGAGAYFLLTKEVMPQEAETFYSHGYQPTSFFDAAYEKALDKEKDEKVLANSAVVAHHLFVAEEIASLFETITLPSETIVLISPNHFSRGHMPIQLSKGAWQTPYGILQTNTEAVDQLLNTVPYTAQEEQTFEDEHGISALTPFLKRSFPNATLVPIVLSPSIDTETLDLLAATISEQLPDALVVASIDMSHELPNSVALFHDEITSSVLTSGKTNHQRLEIDAQTVLETLLLVNEKRQTQSWNLTYHGTSSELPSENVSHLIGYYTKGASNKNEPLASLLFVGDLMFDRAVEQMIDQEGVNYPLARMKRYLSGTDHTVGNLEGTIGQQSTLEDDLLFSFNESLVPELAESFTVLSLANNHSDDFAVEGYKQTVSLLESAGIHTIGSAESPLPIFEETIGTLSLTLIGYNAFATPIQDVLDQLQAVNEERFAIVVAHWGQEYIATPSKKQKEDAQLLVGAGADLIVGHHPHVIQGVELIDDVLVVYSLGNFIFDQEQEGTTEGIGLGITLDQETKQLTAYFLPSLIEQLQPQPPTPEKEEEILSRFYALLQNNTKQAIINALVLPY
jgi:AmmeMemoRadiSam system protein B